MEKKNIIGQNYKSDFFKKNFCGSYKFKDLKNLYSNFLFSYISDFYGPNSNYNLTNRLYESVLNYSIPQVFSEAQAYLKYLTDASTMYKPIDHPVLPKNNDKQLELKSFF